MIPSEPFIRRPVATTLLTIGIALAGAIAYFKLPERLIVVDHIPYSETGKVNRRRLAALIAENA